jgi:hypothetical protein
VKPGAVGCLGVAVPGQLLQGPVLHAGGIPRQHLQHHEQGLQQPSLGHDSRTSNLGQAEPSQGQHY